MRKKMGSSFWVIFIVIIIVCKMLETYGARELSDYYYEHKREIDAIR